MSKPFFVNLATHDLETYEDIKLTPLGIPYCPVCDSLLQPSSPRESNNMWKCENYDERDSHLKCDFIEGKFSKKKKLLWDCRYEPSFMLDDEL